MSGHDPYAPESGDGSFDVESYDLTLDYRVRTNRLSGVAVVNAVAAIPVTAISLDLVRLRATRVRVDGDRRTAFTAGPRKLRVKLPRRMAAGERFSIEVVYAGAPAPRRSRWGTIGWEELEDGALVAAQPTGAPTWFPCNDRPDARARMRIAVTTDAGYLPVPTGRPLTRAVVGGRVTATAASDVPVATYLAAVHIGAYEERPLAEAGGGDGVGVRVTGLRAREAAWLASLDGTAERERALRRLAPDRRPHVARLLDDLADRGLVLDGPAPGEAPSSLAHVVLVGHGRIAGALAHALAGAGVARVERSPAAIEVIQKEKIPVILAGMMMPLTNWAPKLARNSSSFFSSKDCSTSFLRPKTRTSEWPE